MGPYSGPKDEPTVTVVGCVIWPTEAFIRRAAKCEKGAAMGPRRWIFTQNFSVTFSIVTV